MSPRRADRDPIAEKRVPDDDFIGLTAGESRECVAARRRWKRDPFTKKGSDYWPDGADVKRFVTAARKAAADGFPGTALKLGHDLWVYRDHHAASHILTNPALPSRFSMPSSSAAMR